MLNSIKTGVLFVAMSVLLVVVGGAVGGEQGAVMMFVISLAMNLFNYFFCDTMVIKAYRARRADPAQYGWLYRILEDLSNRAQLAKIPDLYIVPMQEPNAFATGRNEKKAVVAVTEGLLETLTQDEIAGVIGHELGHIKHRDILLQTFVASIASAIMMIARIAQWSAIFGGGRSNRDGGGNIISLLATIILAPLAATLIQAGISRSREYMADTYSKELLGTPEPLINGLYRLHNQPRRAVSGSEFASATAHMWIYPPKLSGLANLFSTHPSLEDRVRNLEKN